MEQNAGTPRRLFFLDNLRTAMIFLVVLYHSGAVYESSGIFATFWIVDDPATNDLVGLLNVVIDLFVMPVIFFVSGFLAPAGLRNSTGAGFLARRFRRLMLPWLIAVLTLMPAYKVIFLYSRQLPQEHWSTYFHFSNGIFSQSWLWFLPVLFLFDAAFWALSKANVRPPQISLRAAAVGFWMIGVGYSFGVSILGLSGWTKTILVDFQNERLLIYFMVFLLGALCFKLGTFDAPPASRRFYLAVSCTAWIPMTVYLIVLLNLILRPGQYLVSLPVDLLALWCASHLSMLSLLYLAIATSWFWWNRQGRLGKVLNENAYAVYIIHLPVMGAIALALLNTGIPSLWKYVLLTASTYVVCNMLAYGYRRALKARPAF